MPALTSRDSFGPAFVAVSLTLLSAAHAIFIRHDVTEANYFALASGYEAVGRVGTPTSIGSGTLVSQTQVLTAAHVVDSDRDGVVDGSIGGHSFRFGSNVSGGNADLVVSDIASISVHPLWSATNGNRTYDLAVITFTSPVIDITPMNISSGDAGLTVGTMVGYGLHGVGTDSGAGTLDGLRRAAQNEFYLQGGTIRSDFDNPDGSVLTNGSSTPLALEGSTAGGDSVGPILVDFGNGEEIVGVLSGGFDSTADNQYYGDVSIWAPINDTDNLAYLSGLGIVPIPEPSAGLLCLIGLGALLLRRRVRRAGPC